MRKIGIIVIIVLLILTIGIGSIFYRISKNINKISTPYQQPVNFPIYPTLNVQGKSPATIQRIQRGEYLVKIGDCITCHTNTLKNGQPFAGGLPVYTPYGVIYTSNITPDKKTGIGQWSDADFIKAMKEGISPQHYYYYPAFPFLYFSNVSTEDVIAIKAYLNAIPAIEQPNRESKMVWPFGWRFIQLGWRILFFHPTETDSSSIDANKSPEWNRGHYLVEGLGHCGMCHTPSYYLFNKNLVLAAPMQKYNLAGSSAEGYLAPDITQSSLDDVPATELIKTFTNYQLLGGEAIHGPMVEAVHNSLIYFSNADLLSIITYLRSVKSETPTQLVLAGSDLGKTIYKQHCLVCHNTGVNGALKLGDFIAWDPVIKSGVDKLYDIAIHGNAVMPAKGGCVSCSNKEIEAAVDYLLANSYLPPIAK